MAYAFKNGQGSIILRVKMLDSTVSTGAGKTGLTSASSGLIISTAADNEATATAYTQAGSTIESITTLGTYAAPTATKCRFKEFDATNHPGVYEIQIADARYAVSNAKSLIVSWSGVTGLAQGDVQIPLQVIDPYSINALFTSAMTEAYGTDGSTFTPAQALYQIWSILGEKSKSGTTLTTYKLDGSTTAMTLTLDSSTTPTSVHRTG